MATPRRAPRFGGSAAHQRLLMANLASSLFASGGIVTVVFFTVWGQVFGRTHLGRIQGSAQAATVVASAVGPLLLAETLRRTGSYDVLFFSLAALVAALGLGGWLVKNPARPGALS